MNFTNPYTDKPETKAERIARWEDAERTFRAQANVKRRGFKAKFTKMANIKARQIAELKATAV